MIMNELHTKLHKFTNVLNIKPVNSLFCENDGFFTYSIN